MYVLANWGQRAKAYLIDLAVVLVPLVALWALLLPGLVQRAADDPRLQADFDTIVDSSTEAFPIARLIYWTAIVLLAAIAVYWVVIGLYGAVFISRTAGQTLGGRLIGIRVMRENGQPITFAWALYRTLVVREVLFGIGAIVSLGTLQLAQYLWPLGDRERRTLHDMVARSRVVVDAEEQR